MDPYEMRQQIIADLKEALRHSDSRSAELQCSEEGYCYGMEDAIKIINGESL